MSDLDITTLTRRCKPGDRIRIGSQVLHIIRTQGRMVVVRNGDKPQQLISETIDIHIGGGRAWAKINASAQIMVSARVPRCVEVRHVKGGS